MGTQINKSIPKNVAGILSHMQPGPAPGDLDIPNLVSYRLPKKDPIRTWRRPQTGINHQRKSPRHHFICDVLISNKQNSILGKSENISSQGMFVKTDSTIFSHDEELEITIILKQSDASYQTKGRVMTKKEWPAGSRGFGLVFIW